MEVPPSTPSPYPSPTPPQGQSGAGAGPLAGPTFVGYPITLPRDGTVIVQVTPNVTSASINDLGLAQPTQQLLVADASHVSAVVTVGTFTAGTQLVFSLASSYAGRTLLSTGDHAHVTANGPEGWLIGWEDSDGDFDYDDAPTKICYQQAGTVGCPQPVPQTLGPGGGGYTASQAEPVNTATGNYWNQVIDLAYPGRGLGFAFARTYNSLDTSVGVLGVGWTANYLARLDLEPDGSITYRDGTGARFAYALAPSGGFDRPAGSRDNLVAVGGGFEIRRPDQVRLVFDGSGQLLSMVDRNGNALAFGYVGAQLATITDTVGRIISLSYNGGRLIGLSGPGGMAVSYGYDPSGRLATVTDLDGGTTTYSYDAASRLRTITDQNNHQVVENTYSPTGRVIEQVDARQFHTTFAWDPATEISTMTDARGGQWIDDYTNGVLTYARDPLGNTTTYGFDAELNRQIVWDRAAT